MDNKKWWHKVSINMSKRKTLRLDELKAKRAVLTVSRCSSCSCRKGGGRAGRVQEQASVVSGGVQQLWARATHQWFPIWWWVYRSETHNRKSRYIKLHDKCCSCVASSLLSLVLSGLLEERALLLGRMGKHEQALFIYVHILKDTRMAEEWVSLCTDP